MSHKYALNRLQQWCQMKLVKCISVEAVCPILTQAHLYAAQQLAQGCLAFIREHYEQVAVKEDFVKLAKDWPEVLLKINLYMGQVREEKAAQALDVFRQASTTKR